MQSVLIESQYLPCIEYFAVLSATDQVVLEHYENYQKQSYRNRCRIMTAQGPLELYIPIINPGGKVKTKDVRIDYRQKWVKDHWGAISSAYGNAPFFEHYRKFFEDIYRQKPVLLAALNFSFLSLILKLLKLDIRVIMSSNYQTDPGANMYDWRSKIHPKKALENNPFYKPCNYNQIFGKKFVDNLSIIDLIFCEGTSARRILLECKP